MNIIVAAIIAASVCSEPAMSFREFYEKIHHGWPGVHGEDGTTLLFRVLSATADFSDYREGRRDKCR